MKGGGNGKLMASPILVRAYWAWYFSCPLRHLHLVTRQS